MAEWLSDQWAGELAELVPLLPRVEGVNGAASLAVTSGSGRTKREAGFCWRYENGAPVEGKPALDTGADLVFLVANDDALELLRGEVEPTVSFMRGRLKASGDGALLLGFLQSTNGPEFERWRERAATLAPETSP